MRVILRIIEIYRIIMDNVIDGRQLITNFETSKSPRRGVRTGRRTGPGVWDSADRESVRHFERPHKGVDMEVRSVIVARARSFPDEVEL